MQSKKEKNETGTIRAHTCRRVHSRMRAWMKIGAESIISHVRSKSKRNEFQLCHRASLRFQNTRRTADERIKESDWKINCSCSLNEAPPTKINNQESVGTMSVYATEDNEDRVLINSSCSRVAVESSSRQTVTAETEKKIRFDGNEWLITSRALNTIAILSCATRSIVSRRSSASKCPARWRLHSIAPSILSAATRISALARRTN